MRSVPLLLAALPALPMLSALAALSVLSWARPASAAPSVRWIDETGGVREQPITRVLSESLSGVAVLLLDGKERTIEGRFLLDLIREDDTDETQGRLLDVRLALEAGEAPRAQQAMLDRLAAEGREPWIREYAAAVLAARTGAEGATARIDAFFEKHPKSLRSGLVAQARAALAAKGKSGVGPVVECYMKEAVGIRKGGGPMRFELEIVLASAREIARRYPDQVEPYVELAESGIVPRNPDPPTELLTFSYAALLRLEVFRVLRAKAIAAGSKPYGPRREIKRLAARSSLLLPLTRCELQRELARIHLDFGDADKARAALDKALAAADTPPLRAAVEAELKQLP